MSAKQPQPTLVDHDEVIVGQAPVSIEQVVAVARGQLGVRMSGEPAFLERLRAGRAGLLAHLEAEGVVYGVTTGFGDSCETDVRGALVAELPQNLVRFHGCGVGEPFTEEQTAAIVLARLASLARGYSAVRLEVLEGLARLLTERMLPVIPSQGSVGASGDLTPLSYVAAVLCGEREVFWRGRRWPAAQALAEIGVEPLRLEPKESLALMNGTSAMTGVACLALVRAQRLARWAAALTALTSDVLAGEPRHFDARLFTAKPHPGQALCARWIREDIELESRRAVNAPRVQDRYSVRCAPHVVGVLLDVLPEARRFVHTELNGANDNPLVDPESGDVLHGGNFYGGHVCHAMDAVKTQVANVADLLDRQLALLCHPGTNHGLPANLVGVAYGAAAHGVAAHGVAAHGVAAHGVAAHHGFKAMQITASALTAEALKLTMPASVFSRSTENHNQDKVSMGTIAARDCTRVLELTETVAAIHTLACVQAVDLREGVGCYRRSRHVHEQVRRVVPMNQADRAMDMDIQRVLDLYRAERLDIGSPELGALGGDSSGGPFAPEVRSR